MDEELRRWRLVLGEAADPKRESGSLGELSLAKDAVLEALYDNERKGSLGSSSPNVNRWLGDIRKYFPSTVVRIMQRDALERLGLKQMLLQPELLASVEPDVHLVTTLLQLKQLIPSKTKETARLVVRKVVEELEKRLKQPLIQALRGSLNRSEKNFRPKLNEIDWHQTIRRNLKYYQKDLKTIIPKTIVGQGRRGQSLRHVILVIDQSGSMADSLVYASIFGAIMSSIRSIKTEVLLFDTAVVNVSEELDDPVDLLFGVQLGGGTDIHKAISHAETLIQKPRDTIVILLSDLYEGGDSSQMIKTASRIKSSGAQMITLLALSDEGRPAYDQQNAAYLNELEIPCFACTPDKFPDLMSAAIRKEQILAYKFQKE